MRCKSILKYLVSLLFVFGFVFAGYSGCSASAANNGRVTLGSTVAVTVSCTSIDSGTTVQLSALGYSTNCLDPGTLGSLTSSTTSRTFSVQGKSMACNSNAADRTITWRFNDGSTTTEKTTTLYVESGLTIAADFMASSYSAYVGDTVNVTLQISTQATTDITEIAVDITTSPTISDMVDRANLTIESSGAQKTIYVSWAFTAPSANNYTMNASVSSKNADVDTASVVLRTSAAPSGDSTAPVVTMLNSSFSTTSTTPSIWFTASDNRDRNVSCALYEGTTSLASNSTHFNATSWYLTPGTALSVAAHTVFVNCTDDTSNTGQSGSITVTVTSTTTGGGGGGGGAGEGTGPKFVITFNPTKLELLPGESKDVVVTLKNNGTAKANGANLWLYYVQPGLEVTHTPSSIALDIKNSTAYTVTVKAKSDAALGDYKVTFKANYTAGKDETADLSVVVKSKEAKKEEKVKEKEETKEEIAAKIEEKIAEKIAERKQKIEEMIAKNPKLEEALSNVFKGLTNEKKAEVARVSAEVLQSIQTPQREVKVEKGASKMLLSMKYEGKAKVKNFVVYDTVPKSFAQSADDIQVTAPGAVPVVVEKDPVFMLTFAEIQPQQEVKIEYVVASEVDKDAVLAEATEPTLLAEGVEIVPVPAEIVPAPVEEVTAQPEAGEKPGLDLTLVLGGLVVLAIAAYFLFVKKR